MLSRYNKQLATHASLRSHNILRRRTSSRQLVSYERKAQSAPLEVDFHIPILADANTITSIAPRAGFVVGERYRVSTGTKERFVRVSAKSIDLSKVKLTVATKSTVAMFEKKVGCGHTAHFRAAQSKLSLKLPKWLAHYKEHLLYETLVDGEGLEAPYGSYHQPIPGRSRHAIGGDVLYMDCDPNGSRPLSPGEHMVAMRVYFPTTAGIQTLESPPVRIHLGCS